jgi:hypothetical protein
VTITVPKCAELRREIKNITDRVGYARVEPLGFTKENGEVWPLPSDINAGEVRANITLAYRHLEDASMRLGKAIQALDGGVSVYDRTQVPK